MKKLKDLRKELKMTQGEFPKALNLSQQAISDYERGSRFPDQETLERIATFFDVSIDFLLGRSNNRNSTSPTPDEFEKDIRALLVSKDKLKEGEELTDEKREWLKKLIDQAISMSEM